MNTIIDTKQNTLKYGFMGNKIWSYGDDKVSRGESTENWGKYGMLGKIWNP